ncbi:hypothetical protein DEEACLCL_00105 [Salmonella phage CRW-SP2]|nr:hypothetical protein DEEACLCL_00105 [Salmonella phage CRW-SP2]
MKKYYIQNGVTKTRPRLTYHQQMMIARMHDTETGNEDGKLCPARPKSWFNDKGKKVWSFCSDTGQKVKGDVWDGQTGESLLRKGIIEEAFTMRHSGGYPHPADRDIQFYQLTELGRMLVAG